MRLSLFACAVVMLTMSSSATPAAGTWMADARTRCKTWDNAPAPGDSGTWSGACKDGFASGQGTARYFVNGSPVARYEGEYRAGKRSGHGVFTSLSEPRYRFDGEWRDDSPNGQGTATLDTGQSISGNWSNGCLSLGNNAWAYATVPPEACRH